MVAELRSELRTTQPIHAMSFAAASAAAGAPQQQMVDAAVLQTWAENVEGRLDAADMCADPSALV